MVSETLPAALHDAPVPLLRRTLRTVGHWPALAAVLLVSAGFNLFRLDQQGYGNTYYAAAVKSMLTSWHAFFFASFDAAGFVSVDKPPVGLWVQAASARIFGFSGPSVMAPQAIAGVLSVAVLYHLAGRAFGRTAGLLAALFLALTPITVVVNRNNTMDGLLVLVVLLGAWAVSRAAETGNVLPLLLAALFAGVGFNIKMLQAYLVVPAFALTYLVVAPISRRRRLGYLAVAGVVLVAVSFVWVAIVDLTPADARPYVGSSGTNSALSLALGYNGLGRLTEALAAHTPVFHILNISIDLDVAPAFAPGIGPAGPLRLLQPGVAGQLSWLLPLAVAGLAAAVWQAPGVERSTLASTALRQRRVSVLLWGGWLLTGIAYFSVSRFFHLYYLVMLAPAVAATAGIGVAALWRAYRSGGWGVWLLPGALVGTALVQMRILSGYPEWSVRLDPVIAGACFGGALALLAGRLQPGSLAVAAAVAAVVSVCGLLVAPAVWSAVSVRDGNGGAWLPQAGPAGARPFAGARQGPAGAGGRAPAGRAQAPPDSRGGFPFGLGQGASGQQGGPRGPGGAGFQGPFGAQQPPGSQGPSGITRASGFPGVGGFRGGAGALTFAGPQWNSLDPGLVAYLLANQGASRFLVATPTSTYASLFMLATDQPAMALGGYQGWDRIVTPNELARMVAGGIVRFFYLSPTVAPAGPAIGASQDATADLRMWVTSTCVAVPAALWQSAPAGAATTSATGTAPGRPPTAGPPGIPGRSQGLYDCAGTTR